MSLFYVGMAWGQTGIPAKYDDRAVTGTAVAKGVARPVEKTGDAGKVATAATAVNVATTATTAKPATDNGPALEDIVVTGARANRFGTDVVQAGSFRGAKALDTPLTVNVISRAVIETQQARNLQEVLQNTAGVTVSQTTPTVYSNLAIRGIPVDNRSNYRLDGILPIINLIDMPIEDKDRVEALKGASALYYGFTTPAGIINLTMKRPTQKRYLEIDGVGDSNGGRGGHIDFGQTWGMFGARINGLYADVDSGIDHTLGSRYLTSGAFDLKPTRNLTMHLDIEHIFKEVNEPGIFRFVKKPTPTAADPYPSVTLPPLINPRTNFGPDWARNRAQETNLMGTVDWKITKAWNFSLSGGQSWLWRDRHFNYLDPNNINTNPAVGTVGENVLTVGDQENYEAVNRNARAEVAGTFRSGPLLHDLLVGASINVRDQYNPSTVNHTFAQDYTDPHAIAEVAYAPSVFTNTRINDKGLYAFDRIKFREWLQLLGGIRKSDYTEEVLGGKRTFHATPITYSYGGVIKPIKWMSLYGTYIEGLESTAGAPSTAINYGQQLPAAKSKQEEGGIKIQPTKNLLFQAAYFVINRASTYVNGANMYVEDGRLRYRGFEFSLSGDLTDELSVYASGQALNAKQVSGAPSSISASGVFSPTVVGRWVENTPKYTASVSLNYKLDRVVPGLSVNGGFVYIGRRAIDALNQAWIPGYVLFNMGTSYQRMVAGHEMTFRVNADNITGRRYWASTGADLLAEGAPQVVKFSVAMKY
ncbi:TonB-dependent siderophore receptor [Gluconacetobacter sp. Hr-1-5]|uniref:TonB-dependent siderophore receptor n=1 Tax=Gluconacetobacter sp. Hr-1-5 TaxID=3395370 RepID=UPI003B52B8F3